VGPLHGRRILITRPRRRAAELVGGVRALGGTPLIYAAIATSADLPVAELDAALLALRDGDWIAVTSASVVPVLAERWTVVRRAAPGVAVRVAAIGPATAAAIAERWRPADIVAVHHDAHGLAAALPVSPGATVLHPTSDLGGVALHSALAARGVAVKTVSAYRTRAGVGLPALARCIHDGGADAVLFASGSAVRFTAAAVAALGTQPAWPAIFCIGQSTAGEVVRAGLTPQGVADSPTARSLLGVVVRWFASRDRTPAREIAGVRRTP
jgi:uroporphyrinogen III methyltransferase/synthase